MLRRGRNRTRENRDILLLDGAVGVGLATQSLFWPTPLPTSVVWVVGAWAIVTGTMELLTSQRLRRALEREWSLAIAGVASISFGVLTMLRPLRAGATTWPLGAWALAFGILTIALGVRLRSFFIHAHGGGRQMPRLYLAR